MTTGDPGATNSHSGRSAARLAAVQALYQIDLTGISPDGVVAEFVEHRFDKAVDDFSYEQADPGPSYEHADPGLFSDLVRGASARREEIDGLVGGSLTAKWTVERLEKILRAILRLGTYELVARIGTPARVVITEYVDVANAFFDGGQPALVNGVLDALARRLRNGELADSADTADSKKNPPP